jgi:PAS domain S-box-containing protein
MTTKNDRPEETTPSVITTGSHPTASDQSLRRQAEDVFRKRLANSTDQDVLSLEKNRHMLYELQVHQIELEMQNEELRHTHVELDVIWKRYYDLYDLAPTGYCTLSEKGLFLEVNLTAATMLGTSRKELVRCPITRFIARDDQDMYYLHRRNLFETGELQTVDLRMVKKDGTPFWTTLVATIAQDVDGAPLCRVVMSDITELKKAQEEKIQHNLEMMNKKAERMQSIGRLAGGVAHDFNNMLGVILGYTEMALSELSPVQPLYADLKEIANAAQRCANLTQQLLAFASRQMVAPKVIDLNQVVTEMYPQMRQKIGENIEFSWLPGADLWLVNMDPAQICQMLTNLCENARDALGAQGLVTIETENTTLDESHCARQPWLLPGDYVQLTISDNGCGMQKEVIDNLFEPFFTTKEIYKSPGLGLATVYGAVKQNGGFIDVTSELEQGTTFTIYLPRYVGVNRKEQFKNLVQQDMPGQETILVVEDEPIVLELVTKLLKMKGYIVIATTNPLEAINIVRDCAGKINLLLTDVLMPEMNGDELAQKLLTDFPSLKCLFMSGYTADIVTHTGLLDEEIHFIQKPFAFDSLIAKVHEVIKGG